MEKKNGFITFIAALVPGLGYMYLGLMKKGVQTLVLFLVVKHFFPYIGLSFLSYIILIPFWFYTFFDTFNIAGQINRGEQVNDCEFVFENSNTVTANKITGNRNFFAILAWVLIAIGSLAIVNIVFADSRYYHLFISYISSYFFPLLLITGGIYMLLKEKNHSSEK